jgi:hypothetical protein
MAAKPPRQGNRAKGPRRRLNGESRRHIEDLEDDNIFIYAMRYADDYELQAFIEWLKSEGILTEGQNG